MMMRSDADTSDTGRASEAAVPCGDGGVASQDDGGAGQLAAGHQSGGDRVGLVLAGGDVAQRSPHVAGEGVEARSRLLLPDGSGYAVANPVGLLTDKHQTGDTGKRAAPFRIGDAIDGLGNDYVQVPLSKWNDTPMWTEACKVARAVYRKALIPNPSFDEQTVRVLEYHGQDRIVFVFAAYCRPYFQRYFEWRYWVCPIKLTPPLKAHLVLSGRWKSPVRH